MDDEEFELPSEAMEDPAAYLAALMAELPRREDPICDDTAFSTAAEMVDAVVTFYLESADFNGMPVVPTGQPHTALQASISLGLVQLVTDDEFPNPHIRPWQDDRTDRQLEQLERVLDPDTYLGGCLYPTPAAMDGRDLLAYNDMPYAKRRAAGHGDLECIYFKMDALETYRNDPRYHFTLGDYAVDWGVGDEAYEDEDESEDDKIRTVRAGFGYNTDVRAKGDAPIHRHLVALLCDLGELTPVHQRRLNTWEVPADGLFPHPLWWDNVTGRWAEQIGPFDKILVELSAINDIWTIAFAIPLFKSTERPREWGWVFRPSSNEWDRFIQLTDQLISDNIDAKALNAASAPTENDQGQRLGSLNRFEAFLASRARGDVAKVFKVFKDVRAGRNKPSHNAGRPVTDKTVIVRQRDLLLDLALSLSDIRRFLSTHPVVREAGWEPPTVIDDWLLL